MIRGTTARRGELPDGGIILIEDEFWKYCLKMEDIRFLTSRVLLQRLLQRLDSLEVADWACVHVEG